VPLSQAAPKNHCAMLGKKMSPKLVTANPPGAWAETWVILLEKALWRRKTFVLKKKKSPSFILKISLHPRDDKIEIK
jgi:hypothetical protein